MPPPLPLSLELDNWGTEAQVNPLHPSHCTGLPIVVHHSGSRTSKVAQAPAATPFHLLLPSSPADRPRPVCLLSCFGKPHSHPTCPPLLVPSALPETLQAPHSAHSTLWVWGQQSSPPPLLTHLQVLHQDRYQITNWGQAGSRDHWFAPLIHFPGCSRYQSGNLDLFEENYQDPPPSGGSMVGATGHQSHQVSSQIPGHQGAEEKSKYLGHGGRVSTVG